MNINSLNTQDRNNTAWVFSLKCIEYGHEETAMPSVLDFVN
jgi:hypothetical protein